MAEKKRRAFEMDVYVVGIDSNYEEVTRAAYEYRQEHVYPYLEFKGYSLELFQGALAYRVYVARAVAKPNVDYVTGVGHGLEHLYTGQYGDVIFEVGHYSPEEVRGKIVHLLSCQTAARLGPDFVQKGCRAYFGYDVNFTFFMDYKDVYFECDSEIDRAFADGLTARDVTERVMALFDKRIVDLRNQGAYRPAAALEMDRDHLRTPMDGPRWGEPDAKLE